MSASAHIERLRAHPDDMVDLDPYDFEAVVAELLAGFDRRSEAQASAIRLKFIVHSRLVEEINQAAVP